MIAGGDLSARAPAARIAPQELATLGEGLNGMAARLQSLVAEITRERDRDRAMIGSLAEGVLAVDPDGAVVVANDAANRLLRLGEGVESARLEALPPAILDAVLAARAAGAATVDRRTVVLEDGTELEVTRRARSPTSTGRRAPWSRSATSPTSGASSAPGATWWPTCPTS